MARHTVFRGYASERKLDAELRHHFEEQLEANIVAGMTPAEARREGMLPFGGIEKTEECRYVRPFKLLEDLGQDLRYGLPRLSYS